MTAKPDAQDLDQAVQLAHEFQSRAYAPYSKFNVGAVAITGDGSLFGGANVENASYPMGLCAERAAVSAAVSAGHREIAAIVIAGPEGSNISPCGGCRQFLNEFNPEMLVHCVSGSRVTSQPLSVLLPDAFGPCNLR